MRRKVLFLLVLAVCAAGLTRFGGAAAAEKKKLTLMVYMCGSNLESRYGLASEDIQEMLDSGVNSDEISLLVMTGGASKWTLGFDPEKAEIHEIGKRGMRTVKPDSGEEYRNMGDPETLGFFLRFCREKYPAENYALILWDHGGGPMTGACWDELFSMDYMSLEEIAQGISYGGFNEWHRLSWIGFDACLMSSLEVAATMAPCAEYMIASQETEPPHGWNYSFLAGLENDENGAETGRRVIDAYMGGAGDTSDPVTLSCTDLGQISRLIREMDAFFSAQAEAATEEEFPVLSNTRMLSRSFGKDDVGDGDEAYDLVDLGDLVGRLDPERAKGVLAAISGAVVHSRSSAGQNCGLSVYHPYRNKKKYADAWRESYQKIATSTEYANYLFRFGALLTSGETVDWSGLKTADSGSGGTALYTCELTEAQAEEVVSARLLILRESMFNDGVDDVYGLVGTCPARIENGKIIAEYSGRSLYFVNPEEGGEDLTGPLGYRITEDGRQGLVTAILQRKDKPYLADMDAVAIFFSLEGEGDEAPVEKLSMRDNATGTYSSRMTFRESDYSEARFYFAQRIIPSNSDNGTLPGFSSWADEEGRAEAFVSALRENWSLRFVDANLTGQKQIALFEITDVRQNTFCSAPVRVRNPGTREIGIAEPVWEDENLRIEAAGEIRISEQFRKVEFTLRVTNLGEENAEVVIRKPVLNGRRVAGDQDMADLEPGQTKILTLDIRPDELAFMTELTSLEAEVDYRPGEDYDRRIVRTAVFPLETADITDFVPERTVLAETEQDDILWQLLDIAMDEEGDFTLTVRADSRGQRSENSESWMTALNGIQAGQFRYLDIMPGLDQIITETVENSARQSSFSYFAIESVTSVLRDLVLSDRVLERHGFDSIETLTLTRTQDETGAAQSVTLTLDEPWKIPEFKPDNETQNWRGALRGADADGAEQTTLLDWPLYAVRAERVLAGDNGFILCLEIENKSSLFLDMYAHDYVINGEDMFTLPEGFLVAPGTKLVTVMTVVTDDLPDVTEIESFAFKMHGAPQLEDPEIRITFDEPLRLGVDSGDAREHGALIAEAPDAPDMTADLWLPLGVTIRATERILPRMAGSKWQIYDGDEFSIVLNGDQTARLTKDGREWPGSFWVMDEDGNVVVKSRYETFVISMDEDNLLTAEDAFERYHLELKEEP